MAGGVAFNGLASGMDTAGIINAMLTVDNARVSALQAKKTSLTQRSGAVSTLRSKLMTLQSKLEALRFQSQVLTRTATSSNATGVTASATSVAQPGSFDVTVDQLATSTRRTGASGVGDPTFDPTAALAQAGFSLTPTAGKFTVAGVSIDASAATSVKDFIDAINAGQATVVAEAVDAGGNALASNDPTAVRIRLRNADGSNARIFVGSAGDTSNFLTAAKLSTAAQAVASDRIESTSTLGRLKTDATLVNARLAAAVDATGTFAINGVSFSYDTSVDSINTIVNKINSSTANVTAQYDAVSDRFTLSAKTTGAQSISISDTGGGNGNLMAALGATNAAGASETLGANALYRVSTVAGGAQQSSTSNAISDAVPGITFNLLQQGATSTIAIGQDTTAPVDAMKAFVQAFNDLSDYVRSQTKPDANGKSPPLHGETGVRMVADQLRIFAVSAVSGLTGPYSQLNQLGISFGAVGSSVGSTNAMVFDEAKFKAALTADANAVHEVLNNATVGNEGVFQKMRTQINSVTLAGGLLTSITDGSNARQTSLDGQIKRAQNFLEQRRSRLESQFSRMEVMIAQFQAQGQRLQGQLSKMG